MVLHAYLRHALFGLSRKPTTVAAASQSWATKKTCASGTLPCATLVGWGEAMSWRSNATNSIYIYHVSFHQHKRHI